MAVSKAQKEQERMQYACRIAVAERLTAEAERFCAEAGRAWHEVGSLSNAVSCEDARMLLPGSLR